MKIEEMQIKLPRESKAIERFYRNCERRKKFIVVANENYKKHLKKSKHDLYRAIKEFQDKCWDWTAIKAYYAIHHVGNALLIKQKGMLCKDHSCLIIALKYYNVIKEDAFRDLSFLHESFSDVLGLDLTFQLRKIGQYNVNEWENITEKDASLVISIAKKFINFVENV
jgi:uncharacterized protein (UPF0332 family)